MSKELMTRNDIRKLGLEVTNTTFQRWEKVDRKTGRPQLLRPVKPGGKHGRVYYKPSEVERLLDSRSTLAD